ncbi:MAG: hypothetical protein AAGF67_16135, partial [Verrucomicrobiota bacterium]
MNPILQTADCRMAENFADYSVLQPDLEESRTAYQVLQDRLEKADSAECCLEVVRDWDQEIQAFAEWYSLTSIRFQQDTTNESFKAAKDTLDQIAPKFADLSTRFKEALLDSPFRP